MKHLTEGRTELSVAIHDQEVLGGEETIDDVSQIPRDLLHERGVRRRGRAGDVDAHSHCQHDHLTGHAITCEKRSH
jgi:hypothetical protein